MRGQIIEKVKYIEENINLIEKYMHMRIEVDGECAALVLEHEELEQNLAIIRMNTARYRAKTMGVKRWRQDLLNHYQMVFESLCTSFKLTPQ